MALEWSPGDRVMIRLGHVNEPATVRGGYVTEALNEYGVPLFSTETYSVALDSEPRKLRQIDRATIIGAAPE